MKSLILSAVFSIFLLLPCTTSGEIYGWVDGNGIKHYSNDPPPEGIKAFTQTDEIQTDPAQEQKRTESDRKVLKEMEQQAAESDALPEQADSRAVEPDAGESAEKQDDGEAFHRERIKRRTRQNTSPSPGLQRWPRIEAPQIRPQDEIQKSEPARQAPRAE